MSSVEKQRGLQVSKVVFPGEHFRSKLSNLATQTRLRYLRESLSTFCTKRSVVSAEMQARRLCLLSNTFTFEEEIYIKNIYIYILNIY